MWLHVGELFRLQVSSNVNCDFASNKDSTGPVVLVNTILNQVAV